MTPLNKTMGRSNGRKPLKIHAIIHTSAGDVVRVVADADRAARLAGSRGAEGWVGADDRLDSEAESDASDR
jgi:hypothetical protein